ncbi:aspartyl/asparaginyl beta-hydroxylase domain-containing protein [Paraglaciecola aquimarina]|uniref:Aspartyl/asparaginyl beta-hydroxylase domain-containing protein n=1 Tax=Paraglaciecola algarum TaxID=3050085 RepID=A0ABS9D6T0_9ALTE|nr:aspartyl/asparaginyl beta-hydroxylase domain-containing protein [Paraglaciecola sp. G1-23]MCF2948648.1 aspartyl/asparaginyl beta-hydroxylase domain-containing protein [Paraglaciecola sp. G1-23]
MKQCTNHQDVFGDRIKLPFSFDADLLLKDVSNMQLKPFVYYDVIPLRNPAHLIDPTIPAPPPSDDYADGSWCEWMNSTALINSPNIMRVIDYFSTHCTVTLVRLLRLQAGSKVAEHTDPTLAIHIERSVIRLTIPIQSEASAKFYLNHEVVAMRPGECWYLRLSDPHSIEHYGQLDRINMTIDLQPNEWLLDKMREGFYNKGNKC